MALFRRKRAAVGGDAPTPNGSSGAGSDKGSADTGSTDTGSADTGPDAKGSAPHTDAPPADDPTTADETDPSSPARAQVDPDLGPFDAASLTSRDGLVDLGAILLPGIQGLVMSMEMDQSTGEVTAVRIHLGESQLQLQAFAAPKSSGIWDEIRTEIAQALGDQGGSSVEQQGPFGTELVVRVPGRGADGRAVTTAMRFIGIDRPRWFLRGVVSGPAATDEAAAQPFIDLLHVSVVDRGGDPMAPRELLPLRLPPEAPVAPGMGDVLDSGDVDVAPPGRDRASTDDLRPFERGPEITEVR